MGINRSSSFLKSVFVLSTIKKGLKRSTYSCIYDVSTMVRLILNLNQARCQDSVTGGGGGRNKFWGGTRSFCYVNSKGAREVCSSVDQTKKVKTKKKVFSPNISTNSGCRFNILAIFHEFFSEDQKKKIFVPKVL